MGFLDDFLRANWQPPDVSTCVQRVWTLRSGLFATNGLRITLCEHGAQIDNGKWSRVTSTEMRSLAQLIDFVAAVMDEELEAA